MAVAVMVVVMMISRLRVVRETSWSTTSSLVTRGWEENDGGEEY